MKYGVRIALLVSGPDVLSHVEQVIDALEDLEGCHEGFLDGTVGFDGTTHEVMFDVAVQSSTPGSALDLALSVVRSGIHGAGGATPGWDDESPDESAVVYRLENEDVGSVRQLRDLVDA